MRWILALATVGLAACSGSGPTVERKVADTMQVSSSAFTEGTPIPSRYSCQGQNASPPLAWSGVPAGTAELALVVDDPDAPGGTYTHWVLFHLDPDLTGLAEGQVPAGARQARNSAGKAGYSGPCPPPGPAHHYRFTLYALGQPLGLADGARLGAAVGAIGRAATAQGRLTGSFAR
jgi:Raf kinase inhibitor-like YbhB/YbcL family protein